MAELTPKFPLKKVCGVLIMDEPTKARRQTYIAALKEDVDYEEVIRPVPKWNTGKMSRYFHGPVRKFILAELRKKPFITTEDQLKSDFKQMFGPKEGRVMLDGKIVQEPKSTGDYTFDEFWNFLERINEWCMSNLQTELPLSTEVE